MYHILIVDDERIEREGIIFLLKKLGMEFKVSQAVNGQKALEILSKQKKSEQQTVEQQVTEQQTIQQSAEQMQTQLESETASTEETSIENSLVDDTPVDILLTDVKMPFMDGIELIRHVKELGLSIKTIIFSGYNEFEYAKLAVKLGVSDYILKPVNPQEFKNTLEKVVDEMDQQHMQEENQVKRDEYMREYLLYSLVNGGNATVIKQQAQKLLDSDFWNQYQRLLLIEFRHDFFGKVAMDFAHDALKGIDGDFQYLNLNQQQGVILLKEEENATKNIAYIAQTIHDNIWNKYGERCYIAISDYIDDYDEISNVMEQVDTLMENRFYQTQTFIYGAEYNQQDRDASKLDDDTLMKQMQQDIHMKDMDSLQTHFERLCSKYENVANFSQIYIKFTFSNLLKEICEQMPKMNEQLLTSQIEKLYQATDFQTVKEVVASYVEELVKQYSNNKQSNHREIDMIKQYIYTHYQEEIGVDGLASMVYLAPSYLSSVFKKETGQNLSKFIKQYRMEKAKDMLENSNKKIVTISNEVGYPNVSYFCQSFRECFGVSPQKFRTDGIKYA